MKQKILIILSLMLLISLYGCSEKNSSTTSPNTPSPIVSEPQSDFPNDVP